MISMFSSAWLAKHHAAMLSSVGSGSPAYWRECQLPASNCASVAQWCSPAMALALADRWLAALVVRASVVSCSKNGTPSLLSFTSHSNIR